MNRLFKGIVLLVMCNLFIGPSFAGNGLTLNQAIDEGLKNNPQVKISSAANSEALWKKKETFGSYLPKIDAIANHFVDLKYQQIQLSPGTVFESTYPVTTMGLQASINLFDGFRTTYLYSAATANVDAADLELRHAKMVAENSIRLKFFQALGAQVLLNVAEINVKTLSDHFRRAQKLLEQGEFTKVDVLKIKVQLEQAIPEKLAAEDEVYITRKNLSEAMGIENDDRVLEETLPVPNEKLVKNNDSVNISASLTNGRLDLLALQKRVESSNDIYKASHSIWMPKVNLIADYQAYNNRNFSLSDTQSFKNAYSIGVNLVWNIFDGGGSLSRAEQSYFQKIQLEQKERKLNLSSATDFEFWKRKYLNSTVFYAAHLRSVEASRESVRIYQNGLKAGTRTNSDLLDAELDLDRSGAGVVKAQVDAVEALLNIELALGRRL